MANYCGIEDECVTPFKVISMSFFIKMFHRKQLMVLRLQQECHSSSCQEFFCSYKSFFLLSFLVNSEGEERLENQMKKLIIADVLVSIMFFIIYGLQKESKCSEL